MDDHELSARIERLVAEEHRLTTAHADEGLDEGERARLHRLEVELDQAWDLLRQRRAKREFGNDPDRAVERPAPTVEGYEQ
jgi:hypothetical protein